jgi:antitoxin YefM
MELKIIAVENSLMQAITVNQALQNFVEFMDEVSDNHEPLIITHDHHKPVVLVSLEDFNAWQETDYLTRSPANAQDLLQAVEDINERKNLIKKTLIEE